MADIELRGKPLNERLPAVELLQEELHNNIEIAFQCATSPITFAVLKTKYCQLPTTFPDLNMLPLDFIPTGTGAI